MITIHEVNPAQAYCEGMLWTEFGVQIFRDNVVEWQIDASIRLQRMLKSFIEKK